MVPIYQFQEHCLTVSGEKKDLLALAAYLRNAEGTLGDLQYRKKRTMQKLKSLLEGMEHDEKED